MCCQHRPRAVALAIYAVSCIRSVGCVVAIGVVVSQQLPRFGREVPHLRCDSHTSFKVNRSVSPSPLMLADPHRVPYLTNAKEDLQFLQTYHILLAPPSEYKPSLRSPQLKPQRCVEYRDFNVLNRCSEHSVITDQCWFKYYCRRKVIITIFISNNHHISKAITAHPFKLVKILSSPLMLPYLLNAKAYELQT